MVQDLSPGSIEEAEEAEPDDEFKDAIEVVLPLEGIHLSSVCLSFLPPSLRVFPLYSATHTHTHSHDMF